MVTITIVGEPMAKARPRVSIRGRYAKAYTPQKTINYENLVKVEYHSQKGKYFCKESTLRASIIAYFKMPKNVSKRKYVSMVNGSLRPTKRPDLDNIAKIVLDALNGVAYADDSQICELYITKYYSEQPRVVLRLEEITDGKE